MSLPAWSIPVLKSTLFQQTAPLIVIFLIPALLIWLSAHLRRIFLHNFTMGIESWGFLLPWLWSSSDPSSSNSRRKSKRKNSQSGATGNNSGHKAPRTHAEQIALSAVGENDASDKSSESEWDNALYYPGLVNISGTYCFMNSTLQALASLSYLQPQIDAIHAKAEALDVPTPVIDALHELFNDLNTPKSSYHSIRPHRIINALSSPAPFGASSTNSNLSQRPSTSSTLFNSREHQDAQELFQLVSECIKNEMGAVDKEGWRDRGIAGVLDFGHRGSGSTSKGSFPNFGLGSQTRSFAHSVNEERMLDDARSWNLGSSNSLITKSVFDGLTANRRSCVKCGYTEAVMHFGFDNWQLAVPRLATSCRLEDCLEDYTRLEILKDCVCRKCSVLATHRRLLQELKALEEVLDLVPQRSPTTSSIPLHALSSSPNTSPSRTNFSTPGSSLSGSTAPLSSSSSSNPKPSASKKRRYKEVKRMEQSVRTALSEGRIEDEKLLSGVRLERVVSPASTKQAMIARPPPVLALHLNRSMHFGQFASKNTIKVHFPEILDLSPYTTSGSLSTVPTSAISTPSPPSPSLQTSLFHPLSSFPPTSSTSHSTTKSKKRSKTPTPDTYRASSLLPSSPTPETQRTIYRLTAVVCHYGQHSFGHYVCYRRKPRIGMDKSNLAGDIPVLVMPESDDEEMDEESDRSRSRSRSKRKRKGDNTTNGSADPYSAYSRRSPQPSSSYHWQDHSEILYGSGKGWLRISDDSVVECGIENVMAEGSGAFMLFYERAVWDVSWMNLKEKEREKAPMNGVRVLDHHMDGKGDFDVDDGDLDGDGDSFSIGSEETLRPKTKVIDLNGSVGSLVSEVGVGIRKQQRKDGKGGHEARESTMSSSVNANLYSSSVSSSPSSAASSSKIFGPRIVRSVNARRGHSVGTNGSAIPASEKSAKPPVSEIANGPLINGANTQRGVGGVQEQRGYNNPDAEGVQWDMTASAPSILQLTNNSSVKSSNQMGLGSKSTKMMIHHAVTTTNP